MHMKTWVIIAAIVAAGLLSCFASSRFAPARDEKSSETAIYDKKGKTDAKAGNHTKRLRRTKAIAGIKSNSRNTKESRPKPVFQLDDDVRFSEELRRLVEAINAALDANDMKRVLKYVQALQMSEEWPDGVPKSIKMAAIDALGWFGSYCLPEIAGFIGDADTEVAQSAIEKYEEALNDIDLSDGERAHILIMAASVINDTDAMDSMLFELNNMRHSVAIEASKSIMQEGTEAAKSLLPENVEFYTGEENLDTPEKLDRWLLENPDEEGDEEFYGGTKDE